MNPQLMSAVVEANMQELQRRARWARTTSLDRSAGRGFEAIVIRESTADDERALERLTELDEYPGCVDGGRWLLGEVNGRLEAALPLQGGAPVADPFRPTSELIGLLRVRAGQLAPRRRGAGWLRRVIAG